MYYIYILASGKNGTLYIGVTNDLVRRIYEHKMKTIKGFTGKYSVNQLVYFEETPDVMSALNREKRLKRYKREWKIALIEKENPGWKDLSVEFLDSPDKPANDAPPVSSRIQCEIQTSRSVNDKADKLANNN